jgi:Caspase domain
MMMLTADWAMRMISIVAVEPGAEAHCRHTGDRSSRNGPLAMIVAFMLFVFAWPGTVMATETDGRKYALIVGVSGTGKLAPPKGGAYDKKKLVGPKNDVPLIWHTLKGFGFKPENMVVLSDGINTSSPGDGDKVAAAQMKINGQPTAERILHHLRDFVGKVEEKDTVVFYFAGHGTYINDDDEGKAQDLANQDSEPDGLDELLLPLDAKYNSADDRLENVIRDDEIRKILATTKGLVWLIVDACHSGDLTRGTAVTRFVDPVTDLGIPRSRLPTDTLSATRNAAGYLRRIATDGKTQWVPPDRGRNIIAFSAVPSNLPALERRIKHRNNQVHGIFTHAIAKAMTRLGPQSGMTYRQLGDETDRILQSVDRSLQPAVYEGDIDRRVGMRGQRPKWRAIVNSNGKIDVAPGGMLHGIDTGAILALHGSDTQGDKQSDGDASILAYMKITWAGLTASQGELVAFNDLEPPRPLSLKGKMLTATLRRSISFAMRVVMPMECLGNTNRAVCRALSNMRLESKAEKGLPVSWISPLGGECALRRKGVAQAESADADYYLCLRRDYLEIVPIADGGRPEGREPAQRIEIGGLSADGAKERLAEDLWRVLRAWNLLRVAALLQPDKDVAAAIKLEVRIARGALLPNAGQKSKEEVDCRRRPPESLDPEFDAVSVDLSKPLIVRHCDLLYFNATNDSDMRYDITLLYIDALGAIAAFSVNPQMKARKSLPDAVPIGIFSWCRSACPGGRRLPSQGNGYYLPLGTERLMFIAVQRENSDARDIASFTYLAQSALTRGKSERGLRGASAHAGALGDFEALLRDAGLSPGKTRGRQAVDYRKAIIKTVRFELVKPKPAGP